MKTTSAVRLPAKPTVPATSMRPSGETLFPVDAQPSGCSAQRKDAFPGVPRAFIEQLRCPYCWSGLELRNPFPADQPDVEYGLLRCACHEYPILKGIILLQQRSPYFAGDIPQAVRHLRDGEYEKALMAALWLPPLQDRRWLRWLAKMHVRGAGRRLQRIRDRRFAEILHDPTLTFHQAAERIRVPFYAQYLFHRYANASFLAATLLNILFHDVFCKADAGYANTTDTDLPRPRAPRVLDLCCGVGHNSFQITDVCPEAELVACDCDFTNLYVARCFFIPGRICIGLDLEAPMPFPDGYFDAVLCSDAFVHMRSKYALVHEVDRVLDERGLWLFSHFHNALADNPNPGLPLSPSEYQRLFGFVEGRLVHETDMLRTFVKERALDFEKQASEDSLRDAHAFEWVGGRDPSRWRKRIEDIAFPSSHLSSLGVNPIYEVQDRGDHLSCRMMRFSPDFEVECGAFRECIPPQCQIDKSFLSRLVDGSAGPDDGHRLQELLRGFVLVQLPPGYGHLEISKMIFR